MNFCAEAFLSRLQFLDRRKSTLFRVLEELIKEQETFLVTGDPDRRKPRTQRSMASWLDVAPSVINVLISNKSIQLPWGLQAPIKALLPSRKVLMRERLYNLANEHPELSDEGLRKKMQALHGARLSRRSIAQYRKDLNLAGRGRRKAP